VGADWVAFALVGYVVVAVNLGSGFEQDLAAAAEREGVAVNAVASSTQAQITHDHALYALITGLFLLLPPSFLVQATGKLRSGVEDGSSTLHGGRPWPRFSCGGPTWGWDWACSPTHRLSHLWSGTLAR